MLATVLFVDDDPHTLEGFKRNYRRYFKVVTATSGTRGLKALHEDPSISAVVSDYSMPNMNGIQFFDKVKAMRPDSINIMCTGKADLQVAIDAIQHGNLFRFITKPFRKEDLLKAVREGHEKIKKVEPKKEKVRPQRSHGHEDLSIFLEILSEASPSSVQRYARISTLARKLAARLHCDQLWELYAGAFLTQICFLEKTPEIWEHNWEGEAEEIQARWLSQHTSLDPALARCLPPLLNIVRSLAACEKGNRKPLYARILKAICDFDQLIEQGFTQAQAIGEMRQRGNDYQHQVLDALKTLVVKDDEKEVVEYRELKARELVAGQRVASEVRTRKNVLLLTPGTELTPRMIARLRNFSRAHLLLEPIKVAIPAPRDDDRRSRKARV